MPTARRAGAASFLLGFSLVAFHAVASPGEPQPVGLVLAAVGVLLRLVDSILSFARGGLS